MKKRNNLRMLLYALAILILAAWLFVRNFTRQSLPDYNQDIVISGISDEVEVYRDSFGVPHIFAKNEKDLYTTVGYLMAQDRLWQMDLLRRVTTGRLAEILSDDLVEVDILMRSLEMGKKSSAIFKAAEPDLQECLLAFCDGVNACIADMGKKLPFEFKLLGYQPEPWEPWHSINLIGYMAWDLSTGWPNEQTLHKIKNQVDESRFQTLLPDVDKHSSSVFTDFSFDKEEEVLLTSLMEINEKLDNLGLDVFSGSNNWVISGKKSSTGMPILANDMHLGLSIPGVWYQMHQVVEGKLDVTGVVLPGQPMIVAGHNQDIAWGFTNVMTDDLDFYEETIHPDHPDQYLVDGEWRKMRTQKEQIINKSGDTIEIINRFTHRGPLVNGIKSIPDKNISMSWTGLLESNELLTVYRLNRAGNWDEFRDAIRHFVSVNQNIAYADTKGNIGLHSTIGIPLRSGGGAGIYPGDTSLYDWKGLVPFEDLPYSFNPESGYLSSANNRTVNTDYPHYISSWFDLPYRQDRIKELLAEKEKLGIADFIDIQADQVSKMAEKFTPVFLAEIDKADDLTPSEQEAKKRLKDWDYELDRESVGTTIFEYLYYFVLQELTKDELGDELFREFANKKGMIKNFMENILRNQESAWCDNVLTEDQVETFNDIIIEAFKQSLKQIGLDMGIKQDQWKWGKVHQLTLEHPLSSVSLVDKVLRLSRGPYPVGGSHHTVCPYAFDYMEPGSIDHGASHRHIFDLGNWDNSLTIIPTGISGNPASRHYCDQTNRYVTNEYHPDYVNPDKIKNAALYKLKVVGK